MNFQQLEYIVAVEKERHFAKAAQNCFVAQATLSMMIKKMEVELGIQLFDRDKQPVVPTKEGMEIIQRAKVILAETKMMKDFAHETKLGVEGKVHIAIIPTLAPYLLPLFLPTFQERFPKLRITIEELTTTRMISQLQAGHIDFGILSTPLHHSTLSEHTLFYESMFAYAAKGEISQNKKYIMPAHIDPKRLWLLEEGHCLRNQIVNFCALKAPEDEDAAIKYEAGSIETLINIVDSSNGITIVPELATLHLSSFQKNKLRAFSPPEPVREISLVTIKNYPRHKLRESLAEVIVQSVDSKIKNLKKGAMILAVDAIL